jgi:hypothetical protein
MRPYHFNSVGVEGAHGILGSPGCELQSATVSGNHQVRRVKCARRQRKLLGHAEADVPRGQQPNSDPPQRGTLPVAPGIKGIAVYMA